VKKPEEKPNTKRAIVVGTHKLIPGKKCPVKTITMDITLAIEKFLLTFSESMPGIFPEGLLTMIRIDPSVRKKP
jgi:hypothetical protein